ncbi:sodium:solute symporter family transporter [Marinilabilia rubra]|uniref:Sodium:solute symporter n=1 Tax=Marinilabilia rubra TaxID=2162893 RepID=A0A2U2BBD2_9BACT|nr:sodium/solute symporter [Marinilabilia rubra]PWE00382.1 sodium:solute symporter [Marinilabilia rubra]
MTIKKISIILLILLSALLPVNSQNVNITRQENIGALNLKNHTPLEEGLSGYFGGIHNNRLIIAGGSNFANGKPWENGEKQIYNHIITGTVSENSVDWQISPTKLPAKLTDGASVTTPEGVVCSGGTGPEGISDKAFLLNFSQNEITIQNLPSLPFPVKGHDMALIGNTVYLTGGEAPHGPSRNTLSLNLTNKSEGWLQLADMPEAITGMVLEAQSNGKETALFAIGGRLRMPEDSVTSFKNSVLVYSPTHNTWTEKGKIRPKGFEHPLNLAVAAGAPAGASHIIVVGGDPGTQYNKIEEAINKMAQNPDAKIQRDSLWINHPGFNSHILVYNTITDKWFATDQWEGPAPVMAKMIPWNNRYIIPMGEVSPGIRTAEIKSLEIASDPVFGWINYLVLGLYFAGMLYLGFYFVKKDGDVDDYFKAGGRIPWWAAGISIFATTLSAITFISIPAKAYATDWHMLVFQFCIILIAPFVIRYFLPFFRRFNLSTAYQYLELRFNSTLKWLASALFILFMVTRIAVVLYLPSLALNAVTGFDIYLSIILMGVVTIIYCTSGGIEAVVWGDVIQGIILMGGAVVAFIFMITGIDGGISGFTEIVISHEKMHIFDFSLDISKPVFWVVLIGGLANTLILYTSDQSVVQRYMTTKDEKSTGRSIWLNGIISIPVSITFFLLGTGLFAFYYSNPEKLAATNPNIDSVFPQFIVGELPAGMAGLLISAIFAAAMSTLSSNINSVASVFTSDFYMSIAKKATQKKNMMVARVSSIVIGILGIGMALVLATWSIESLWDQFNTFLGLLTSGIGALFLMGIFSKRISPRAALGGLIGGLVTTLLVKQMTDVSFLLYGAIGLLASLAIAFLLSFIFPNKKDINRLTYHTLIK